MEEACIQSEGSKLIVIIPLSLSLAVQELQRLQRANQQLREEVRRLEETMAHNMVDCRDMEAALRRVEDEVRHTHTHLCMDTIPLPTHRLT